MTEQTLEQQPEPYLELIQKLLNCPNGQEPEVLDAHPVLLNSELVKHLTQVAAYFAHHDNPEGARFLVHIARELSRELGLYPQASSETSPTKQEV
jgi:hypothetical protein